MNITSNVLVTLVGIALFAMLFFFLWRNGISGLFKAISETVNGGENAIIDAISAITPYLVPIIPAYLTFFHVHDPRAMNFPVEIAWTAAIVVEFLGMSSMATTIRFWRNNQRYKSEKNQAPFWIALLTYIFYLAITMTVNVLLEADLGDRSRIVIWAIGLFSMLSVPSGVLIAVRSIYREMLEERSAPRKNNVGQDGNEPQQSQGRKQSRPASKFKEQMITMLDKEYQQNNRILDLTEITSRLRLDHNNSKGFVSTVRSNWMQERGIQKPPKKDGLTF